MTQTFTYGLCFFSSSTLPSQYPYHASFVIFQVKNVTGSKILRILKGSGLSSKIPEDLYHLIKKAIAMHKHLERNRKDRDSKFRLILVESRIHRLARYYRRVKSLPPTWKYNSATAAALVS